MSIGKKRKLDKTEALGTDNNSKRKHSPTNDLYSTRTEPTARVAKFSKLETQETNKSGIGKPGLKDFEAWVHITDSEDERNQLKSLLEQKNL